MRYLLAIILMVGLSGCADLNSELVCPSPSSSVSIPQTGTCVLVFVDPNLPACRAARPYISDLKRRTRVVTIDVNVNPQMVLRYHITVMPTYIVLRDGVEIKRTRWAPQVLQRWAI